MGDGKKQYTPEVYCYYSDIYPHTYHSWHEYAPGWYTIPEKYFPKHIHKTWLIAQETMNTFKKEVVSLKIIQTNYIES